MKQYSEACEQNREPILNVLGKTFAHARRVLEIGSGTGQHAVYFASHLPHLRWQTSDLEENHASIKAWLHEAALENTLPPFTLDVTAATWPESTYDGLFSANTTHIMSWPAVQDMFTGIGKLLETDARFCLYGPFNYHGNYTSDSNRRFDAWLKDRDPASGIRHFEALDELASTNDMTLETDYEMPVNNRLLVWKKQPAIKKPARVH
jgi:cyclopropane fatty-acyl-phospholipid synthase-like methyltransferase